MYRALYRTYRPEIFDEMLGQEHIVRTLKNQIAEKTTSHAYLFCGTHGTGKTTTARILAKALNCLSDETRPCGQCKNCVDIKNGVFLDVIEIDAASNNGVENIRELRESVKYPPSIGEKKVYIIDEVHMLSQGAFNALLKTLEEPPSYVMFILATTEPQKLPATILSRCMRLDFKRVPEKILLQGMSEICQKQGIEVEETALRLIAMNADGSVRDGLSILDQCLSGRGNYVTRDDVLEMLGSVGQEVFIELTSYAISGNIENGLLLINKILSDGKDARQFTKDWLSHYRALMIVKFVKEPEDLLNMSKESCQKLLSQGEKIDLNEINKAILILAETISDAKWSTQPRILLELAMVKLARKLVVRESEIPTVAFTQNQESLGSQRVKSVGETIVPKVEVSKDDDAISASVNSKNKFVSDIEGALTKDAVSNFGKSSVHQEEKDRTSGEKPASNRSLNFDLNELWYQVFEEGETSKSSFNIIRSGTKLVKITDEAFYVHAGNDLKLKYLRENEMQLQELIEKLTGKKLTMKAFVNEEEGHKEKDTETVKATLEDTLGIKICIE